MVKQIDWKLAPGIDQSGISYADYNQALDDPITVISGFGNDLNNWPNQAFKLTTGLALTRRLTLHADAQLLWGYRGLEDGIEALREAVAGSSKAPEVEGALRRVNDVGTYGLDLPVNASAAYNLHENLHVQLFGQNLLGSNRNRRYSYDVGIDDPAPRQVRFIQEPRVYGLRFEYRF